MSEVLPDEAFVAAAGTHSGSVKAAAQEARGAQTFAVTSAPTATPIAVGAGGSQFLRGWRLQPSQPFIENLKLGTA